MLRSVAFPPLHLNPRRVGPQAWEKYRCGLFHLLSQYGNFVMTNVRPC
jgi:hypothetical protein